MSPIHGPRVLPRLGGLLELAILVAAALLLALNLTRYVDETLWVATGFVAAYVLVRLLPARLRTAGRLLFVSAALSLTAGEAILRLAGDGLHGRLSTELPDCFAWSDDPVLPYTYRPGARCNESRTVQPSRICDDPHTPAKPPGTFRILVMGDSTSTIAKSYDDLYHQRLEATLQSEGPAGWRFEVVNGAVEGYNATQQVAFLEHTLLDYQPDLIVAAYCLNDPARGVFLWRRARSRLLRMVGLSLAWLSPARSPSDFAALHADPALWADVVAAYERLRDLAAARGVPLVAFAMPVMTESDWGGVYAKVDGLFRSVGAHVLDVHSDLTAADREAFHDPPDSLHPNAAFHARLALRLLSFLQAEGLLPSAPPHSLAGTVLPATGGPDVRRGR